uniref:Cytochrome P450 2C42-like n=1 Tax=Phallusia mammillata TaxID=59560 RepID=A0A6F9D9R2_9ASCI|nr:cytochrome P450 2C42-like [Phallusia mammillata]
MANNPDIQDLATLSSQYGNLFGIKRGGSTYIVCIKGYDLFREVMLDNSKTFAARPSTVVQKILRGETCEGIATSQYGPGLIAHRKLFHSVLRSMGINGKDLAKLVVEELPYFVDELHSLVSSCSGMAKIDDISEVFQYASLNVLAYFTFGNRYSYKDGKFKILLKNNFQIFSLMSKLTSPGLILVSIIPNLYKFWLPKTAREIQACVRNLETFIASEIEYHKSTLDLNSPRDLIDYYLLEVATQSSKHFTETGVRKAVMDVFQAGTETTSTTLKWAVLYMANNPDIQEKIQCEINEVLGNKLPTYEDRIKMPYTEASIMEVQRKASIAPVGVLHAAGESTKLMGYDIPKGSLIVPMYTSFLHSPEHWKNPFQFDPKNFLDANGQVGTRPAFMPFGAGLRACLGINIAKQELFLFFTTMLQHFTFQLPPGILKLDEDYIPGLTLQPKSFQVVLKQRH